MNASTTPTATTDKQALQLVAPQAKGHVSVVRLPNYWYVACFAADLKKQPLARTVLGIPLVLFRDGEGRAGALLDRCPHRNVPLSLGKVAGGHLECKYHGWRFDRGGQCRAVPSLIGEPNHRGRAAPSFPVVEQDGCVWVYPTAGDPPATQPPRLPYVEDRAYTTVHRLMTAQATMHATVENALDVPHTAFLHHGLFRSESRGIEIEAIVRRSHDTLEAEYVGEPRPTGFAARLLSPSGGVVTHFDRFLMPCIAQVEYRLGTENHFVATSVMTPVSDFETAVFAVVSFRLRLPNWIVKPFITPIALRIFKQDALILRTQTDVIERFGGEQFVSTEIDVLGRHIWKMLKQAERGDVAPAPMEEVGRVRLVV